MIKLPKIKTSFSKAGLQQLWTVTAVCDKDGEGVKVLVGV
jgi:hypothetical protein